MAGINFDFTTGSLPAGITFTRASIGTYNNATGTLITAGNDVARLNYISGVSNLLIEPSATNLLHQSNNFASAEWFKNNGAVITAAQFVSPDGTNNGWSMTSGTGFGSLEAIPASTPLTNTSYTSSLWVKRITGTAPIDFYLIGVTAGSLTTSATLTRLFQAITPPAGACDAAYALNVAAGSTNGIFGAQLELGSVMTSYIPTTTAAVTRAADSAVFTIPAGVSQLTYTFDDNSTQMVAVSPGSYTIPTTLNRPNIKSIVGVQVASSTVQLGPFQSLSLAASTPVQLTAGGIYRLAILNTGPGNLYISSSNTPGANATSMLIPPLKMAPVTTTGAALWISSDQAGGVSIAALPR